MEFKNDIDIKESSIIISSTPTFVDDIIEVDGEIFLLQNTNQPEPTKEIPIPSTPIVVEEI